MNTKQCTKCDKTKSLSNFYKQGNYHRSECKECKNKNTEKWRKDNREYYNSQHREYCQKNYQKLRLQRYKLTPEEHTNMLAAQKGVCAICEKLPNGKRPLAIDHNHSTGKVRGLLCYGCNRALHVLENIDLLRTAQDYLKKYGE